MITVETVYPRKKEVHKGFLDAVAGDAKRRVENKHVEDVVSSGSVELDLRQALQVSRPTGTKGSNLWKQPFRHGTIPTSQSTYHYTTALSTSSCFPIGKTKLSLNQTPWEFKRLVWSATLQTPSTRS